MITLTEDELDYIDAKEQHEANGFLAVYRSLCSQNPDAHKFSYIVAWRPHHYHLKGNTSFVAITDMDNRLLGLQKL